MGLSPTQLRRRVGGGAQGLGDSVSGRERSLFRRLLLRAWPEPLSWVWPQGAVGSLPSLTARESWGEASRFFELPFGY